jgi:hypothetical protein
VSQVDEAVAEAAPRPLELGGEVPSVPGAVEEDVGGSLALLVVNHPLGVQQLTGPAPAKGDARTVFVRVEVRAGCAVPQSKLHPVGEGLHGRLVAEFVILGFLAVPCGQVTS